MIEQYKKEKIREAHTFLPVDLEGREEFLDDLHAAFDEIEEKVEERIIKRITNLGYKITVPHRDNVVEDFSGETQIRAFLTNKD